MPDYLALAMRCSAPDVSTKARVLSVRVAYLRQRPLNTEPNAMVGVSHSLRATAVLAMSSVGPSLSQTSDLTDRTMSSKCVDGQEGCCSVADGVGRAGVRWEEQWGGQDAKYADGGQSWAGRACQRQAFASARAAQSYRRRHVLGSSSSSGDGSFKVAAVVVRRREEYNS